MNRYISRDEVYYAIIRLKNSTADPDQIHPSMYKNLPADDIDALTYLINLVWNSERLPTSWKEATIFFFRKPGKDKFELQNYRLIYLTNTICKIMEVIVVNRLL